MAKKKHSGAVIAERREALGWTVYRLAQESGVDASALYRIESGEQATTVHVARQLCHAMGEPLGIIDGCDDSKENRKKASRKNSGEKS